MIKSSITLKTIVFIKLNVFSINESKLCLRHLQILFTNLKKRNQNSRKAREWLSHVWILIYDSIQVFIV